jgi:hypothetical protein
MRTAPRQSTSTHTSTTIMLTKRYTDVDPSPYLSLTQGPSLSFRNLNWRPFTSSKRSAQQ